MCSELRLVSWWAHSLLRISLAMEKIWNRLVVLNTWSLGACLSRFSSSPGQTALFCCSLVAYHKPISITGSSDACVYVQIQWILEFCYCLKPRATKITSVAHPEMSLWYWKQAVPCRWFGSVASYAWWWEWLSCCLLWVRSEEGQKALGYTWLFLIITCLLTSVFSDWQIIFKNNVFLFSAVSAYNSEWHSAFLVS